MAELEKTSTIFEHRERELVISPNGDSNQVLRKAHFLKPILTSIDESSVKIQSSSFTGNFVGGERRLNVHFNGWRWPQRRWKTWVNRLRTKHEATWRKTGIYEAILNTTYKIRRDEDLVLAFAEKWCPETNTFVFPWGEATVSLEDMVVLGGFSVLGEMVRNPFDTQKLVNEADKSFLKVATHNEWMNQFCGCGNEFEHESFLVLFLSRFVFPARFDLISRRVYPIALCLARGIKIALAPAVLASIYNELSLLKAAIVASTKQDVLALSLCAPFQLVQVWIWERFVELRRNPRLIHLGEPRLARWDQMKELNIADPRKVIDSAAHSFLWRPYSKALTFYDDREKSILVDSVFDEDLHSFVRCIRVSELVGLDCIEQYLPHRVAMQFGFDQDLPGHVARSNECYEKACSNYNRPISDAEIYVPARLFESDVTIRYLEWWKQLLFDRQDAIMGGFRKKRSPRRSMTLKGLKSLEETKGDNSHVSGKRSHQQMTNLRFAHDSFGYFKDIPPPPGFAPKFKRVKLEKPCDNETKEMISGNAEKLQNLQDPIIDTELFDESKPLPNIQSQGHCDGSTKVIVHDDEAAIRGSEGEVDHGSATREEGVSTPNRNAATSASTHEVRICELESRIYKLEKELEYLKSV